MAAARLITWQRADKQGSSKADKQAGGEADKAT